MKQNPILLILFSICMMGGMAPAQESEGLVVLPLAGVNGDQGFGLGADFLWKSVSGTQWNLSGGGYHSFNYQSSMLHMQIQNRKLADVFYLSLGLNLLETYRSLFFGFTNNSSLEGPTQYSMRSQTVDVRWGINLMTHLIAGLGAGAQNTAVGHGHRGDSRHFVERNSGLPFVRGGYQNTYKIFVLYDDQEPEFAPTAGSKVLLHYESTPNNVEPKMQRVHAHAKHNFTVLTEDLIVSGRVRHDRTWGADNPFYNQARLGGMSSLRGYNGGRWTDFASFLAGVEGKWNFWEPGKYFNRVEASYGYDVGRVYDSGAVNVLFDDIRPSHVFGLTGILPQGVPLRLDYGMSSEGSQFYMHLFYPY